MRSALILATLQQLHAVHPHAMRAQDLLTGIKLMGFPKETLDSMNSLLADMKEQGLVHAAPDALDGAVIRYNRTDAGRIQLVNHGHA